MVSEKMRGCTRYTIMIAALAHNFKPFRTAMSAMALSVPSTPVARRHHSGAVARAPASMGLERWPTAAAHRLVMQHQQRASFAKAAAAGTEEAAAAAPTIGSSPKRISWNIPGLRKECERQV